MEQIGQRWIETMGFRQRDPMNVCPIAEWKRVMRLSHSHCEVAACESHFLDTFFGHATVDLDRTLFTCVCVVFIALAYSYVYLVRLICLNIYTYELTRKCESRVLVLGSQLVSL